MSADHEGAPRVRQLNAEDLPAALAIWHEAGLPIRPSGRDAVGALAVELSGGRTVLLGATVGAELCGVALATDDGRKGFINRLAVRPGWRRRGVARALVEECERLFRGRAILLVACLIEEHNEGSLALFADAGYEVRRDVLYLRKPLASADW